MKKIFLFILILFSAKVFGQFPTTQSLGSPKTQVYSKGALGSDSGYVFRVCFLDTAVWNLGFIKAVPGIVIRTCDDNLWLRNNTAVKWILIGSGGGSTDTSTIIVDTTYDDLGYIPTIDSLYLKSLQINLNGVPVVPTSDNRKLSYNIIAGGGGSQNLQQVTDIDSVTNHIITIRTNLAENAVILSNNGGVGSINVLNPANSAEVQLDGQGFIIFRNAGGFGGRISVTNLTDNLYFELPNTGNGADTLATFSDVRALITVGVSDIRLKNVKGKYRSGLQAVMNITPIVYQWNEKSGFNTKINYIGFSAQNIQSVLGDDAIGHDSRGYLTIQDRAIMAALVNAIKEQQKQIEDLQKQINALK